MGDPVFDNGLNLAVWIILLVKVVAVFVIVMVSVLFMVMYERKAVAWLGVRYGPNRAGPNGWLQSLADGTKLLFKEAFTPRGADKAVYKVAPYLMLFPALLVFAIVPDRRHRHHRRPRHPAAAGRSALGDPVPAHDVRHRGVRRDAGRLGVGIEVPAARLGAGQRPAGVLRGGARPDHRHGRAGHRLACAPAPSWPPSTAGSSITGTSCAPLLVPFVLFAIAITAEMTRPPFDLVEAEEELSGGYNLEYSSIDFAWFYLAEYAALVTNSAIIVTLWFGGPDGPRDRRAQHRTDLVHDQGAHHPVHLRLDPGHPAPPALRPAHGSGLEAAHPGVLAMLMIVAGRQISYALGPGRLRGQLCCSAPCCCGPSTSGRARHRRWKRPATSA